MGNVAVWAYLFIFTHPALELPFEMEGMQQAMNLESGKSFKSKQIDPVLDLAFELLSQ